MGKIHQYSLSIIWTGNTGEGTKNYRSYKRSHHVFVKNKPVIEGSSDPAFQGDATKHNPEDLFVASIAACHMLWYLHLCSDAGIIITNYTDHATASMVENVHGGGRFTEVTLHPSVTITSAAKIAEAEALHKKANELCYIANSCNFPVHHYPVIKVDGDDSSTI